MASASGSSKSKRSKKSETSELSDDNTSDDSKLTPEVLTPGKRLKTDESLAAEEKNKTNEINKKSEASTSKNKSGTERKAKANKSKQKGEASGKDKTKANKNEPKAEASTSKNESGKDCKPNKKDKQKADASTSKNESGTASKGQSNKKNQKAEARSSSEPQGESKDQTTKDEESSSSSSGSSDDSSDSDFDPANHHLWFASDLENIQLGPDTPNPLESLAAIRAEAEMLNSEREEDSDAEPAVDTMTPELIKKYDPTPNTARPKHKWSTIDHLMGRQYGASMKYPVDASRQNCCGSLHVVERLELMYKMKKHDGCVNTLNFNASGTRLVSGSDDLNVIIWDWTQGEHVLQYRSGHNTNVFQVIWTVETPFDNCILIPFFTK